MADVRIGVIGVGNMGKVHARSLLERKITGARLGAVCDVVPARMQPFDVPRFETSGALIRSGEVDAVIVATPHYDHVPIGIDVMEAGLHLLCEKPLAVHKNDAQRLVAAWRGGKQVFSVMFMTRTEPVFRELRKLVQDGGLGELVRVNWIITDWFRTNTYYASSPWRATWKGEGGGVLMNQCPHNLDLLSWICGMPKRVRATCRFGRWHPIEVEDDVVSHWEYESGASVVLVVTTGEAPGTNRLEICGDRGKAVVERGKLALVRNEVSAREFARTSTSAWAMPPAREIAIPTQPARDPHNQIIGNFVEAIRDGELLIAPGIEGLNQVELSNAMLYSSLTDKSVELPLDGDAFEAKLRVLVAGSKDKDLPASAPDDTPPYLRS
jgi:predicted dehydrogenase